ncbi:MAG: rRNA maturation RNase YbeY [Alphaproteobacteria bacterium]
MNAGATILVDLRAPQWARTVADPAGLCRKAVRAALDVAGAPDGEVSIVLGDDEFIRALNRDHRGQDRPTNVLAFALEAGEPSQPGPRLLGDIVLAYETAAREAEACGRSLSDRLAHLVAHAALHLVGHRHEAGPEAEAMERLEAEALARLGIADPYVVPALAPVGAS